MTARVVNRLNSTRFLAVIGASGSGKSSLVRAGVIPAIRKGLRLADDSPPPTNSARWAIRKLTPTAHPLQSLAVALAVTGEELGSLAQELQVDPATLSLAARRLLSKEDSPHLLLVIDQFEELFTQCHNEEERRAFISSLLAVADPDDSQPVTILIVLRADFYASLAQYDRLRELVSTRQEFIGAMSRRELFDAIVKPAASGNWKIQEGLVETILDDLGDEPGALPLLSHALLETWNHRRARTLTLSAYRESGGVRGAIAKTAETVFRQRLTPEQQPIAQMIFLRLVDLEENARDTRRRAAFSELITRAADPLMINAVLAILTDARLVTTGIVEPGNVTVVEVAHEALIREWPTLREWLSQNRAGLILHRQLTEATNDWLHLERDPGALYRGARLEQALQWATQNPGLLCLDEQEFLNASQQAVRAEAERDRQLARTRLLRRLFYPSLGVLMVGVLAVLFFASGLYIRFKTPARMDGAFNIAVAEIGQIGPDGLAGPASEGAGLTISGWVADKLRQELSSDPNLLVWQDGEDLRQLNVTIGRVQGNSPEERAAAAAEMAGRLNAQMVIFGDIDTRHSPAQLRLEFWLAEQAGYGFEDLAGPYQVSTPVNIPDPARPGIAAQADITNQASALTWLALGLTRMRFGQTSEALDAFQRAVEFTPDSEAAHFYLGRASLFLSERDKARQEELTRLAERSFQQAADLNPGSPRTFIGLGNVYFLDAMRQVAEIPPDTPAEEAGALLAPARLLVQKALAAYQHVLDLPADAYPPGQYLDLAARLDMATSLRLQSEIQYRSGQSDAATQTLVRAARELEAIREPLEAAGQERYLAMTYQTLGTAYQWLGFLAEIAPDPALSKAQYSLAIDYYDRCAELGQASSDRIVREEIAAQLCVPYRRDVQDRLDGLNGGS